MRIVTLVTTLIVCLVGTPSFAKDNQSSSTFPATVQSFSQSALLGMQLSVKKDQQEGKIQNSVVDCALSLKSDQFSEVFEKIISTYLSVDEQKTTEIFFSSNTGKKYTKHGLLQVYKSLGITPPESFPAFNKAEMSEITEFSKTTAGDKLIIKKVIQVPAATNAIQSRIADLMDKCLKNSNVKPGN